MLRFQGTATLAENVEIVVGDGAAVDALLGQLDGGAAAWAQACGSVPVAAFTIAASLRSSAAAAKAAGA